MMMMIIMMMMVMKDDDGEDDSGFMIYTIKRPINSGRFYNFPLLGYSNKEDQNHSSYRVIHKSEGLASVFKVFALICSD